MKWGVKDKEDNSWIGDINGVKVFDDELIAKAAATVYSEQVRYERIFVAEPLPDTSFTFKDEIPTVCSTLKAIQRIEGFEEKDDDNGVK